MEEFGPELNEEVVQEGFAERMKEAVREFGGVRPFARKLGYSVSAVQNWTNGVATPNVHRLRMIARLAGVNLEWLATGQGHRYDPKSLPDDPRAEHPLFYPPLLSQVYWPPERGLPQAKEPELPFWPEISSWTLMQRGVDPHAVALTTVGGDEMEPALSPGDVVLVDTSDRNARPGIWCALDPEGHPYVVRLRAAPGAQSPQWTQDRLGDLGVTDGEAAAGALCGRVVTIYREEAV